MVSNWIGLDAKHAESPFHDEGRWTSSDLAKEQRFETINENSLDAIATVLLSVTVAGG
jgi:hypothetical protein